MNESRLIPDADVPSDCKASADRSAVNRRSALWAAYGDALGWISELTDEAGLRRRTGGEPLVEPIEWRRRVGGRSGVSAQLPKGCYSDDSQLRLATSRAIRSDGFDVEAFAKVELPIWLGYALGGGKSTTAAAVHLGKTKATWFSNRYKEWTKSGGNGAAMRIQPHVWAASDLSNPSEFLPDVVRNAVCTHSHPNGLLGAVMHALALAHTMSSGRRPSASDMMNAVEVAASLPQIMENEFNFTVWRAAFESEAGMFDSEWSQALAECKNAIKDAEAACGAGGEAGYSELVNRMDLRDPSRVGSGVLTAIAAVGLTWCERQPREAMRIAANALGTDTDTIATMAGAVMGAEADADPPVEVMDADLFRSEANRLAEIARGGRPQNHGYPDLLRWKAPKGRADILAQRKDGGLHIHGLGSADAMDEPIQASQRGFLWQWVALESGQTLFVKRRETLEMLDSESVALPTVPNPTNGTSETPTDSKGISRRSPDRPVDLDAATDHMRRNKDDDRVIGKSMREMARRGTSSQYMKFAADVLDALKE